MNQLRYLNLSTCAIESVEPAAFDNLSNLEVLGLNENALVAFETKCTPRKVYLAMNRNLESIKFTGSDLWRIDEIALYGNTSNLVDFNSMFSQVSIQKLGLNLDALGSKSTFSQMKSLKELTVLNELVTIPISSDAFHGLVNLECLKLLNNTRFNEKHRHNLQRIGCETLKSLVNVIKVDFMCGIEEIEPGRLVPFKSLTTWI